MGRYHFRSCVSMLAYGAVCAKILQISSYPPPAGGWAVRVIYIRRELESRGHACAVLNMGPNRRIRSPHYVDVQSGRDYVAKVFWFVRRGYLVHAHLNGTSPKGVLLTIVAQLLAVMGGRGAVLTFHAGERQRYFPPERSRLMQPGYWLVFTLARAIVCNSEAVKQGITRYGVRGDKILAIPAFSKQYLQFERIVLPQPIQDFLYDRKPVLLSYAYFRPENQLSCLVEATATLVRRFPNLALAFVGYPEGAEPLMELAEKLGLARHVHICGDLPHDGFLSLMAKSDVYIRTCTSDGVCSSVLEALSLGVPVIASVPPSRPNGVITYEAGNSADLAGRVTGVLDNMAAIRETLPKPAIRDTVADEADLLEQLYARRPSKTSNRQAKVKVNGQLTETCGD